MSLLLHISMVLSFRVYRLLKLRFLLLSSIAVEAKRTLQSNTDTHPPFAPARLDSKDELMLSLCILCRAHQSTKVRSGPCVSRESVPRRERLLVVSQNTRD